MTDFTEENGATRVIPGSNHFDDKLHFTEADTEPAEMTKGSVLFYTGSIYHGGGANRSKAIRTGINITYNVSWLRQEENQYFSVPLEIARTLPVDLLRLMGYRLGAYALGYVDDTRDPIEVVRPDLARNGFRPVLESQKADDFLKTPPHGSEKKGADPLLTSPCPRGGRRAPQERGGRGAALASPQRGNHLVDVHGVRSPDAPGHTGQGLASSRAPARTNATVWRYRGRRMPAVEILSFISRGLMSHSRFFVSAILLALAAAPMSVRSALAAARSPRRTACASSTSSRGPDPCRRPARP